MCRAMIRTAWQSLAVVHRSARGLVERQYRGHCCSGEQPMQRVATGAQRDDVKHGEERVAVCRPLNPVPHRLRLGEKRGLGPWDPAYFKRAPTGEELRQDLLEREASCDYGRSALAWLAPHVRQARLAHWEQVRNEPVVNIERVLESPVIAYDRVAFLFLVDQIDGLPCDDPRKSVYRLELVKRFRAL